MVVAGLAVAALVVAMIVLPDWSDPAVFDRMEFVLVPAGQFRRGCVSGLDCYHRERPVRTVRVGSFELSKYEVTFEEYDRFTAATGRARADDVGWGRGRRPVIYVSWEDAVAYTRWLSEQTGERYRLPSEAEWEYAARAGSVTKYSWGNEIGHNRANCDGCGSQWDKKQTAPVGSFGANRLGLHDMHGNVLEWVQDCWNGSYRGAPADGSAWVTGDCSQRVLRGGLLESRPWEPARREPPLGSTPGAGASLSGSGWSGRLLVESSGPYLFKGPGGIDPWFFLEAERQRFSALPPCCRVPFSPNSVSTCRRKDHIY